jgi:hypothetical protein
MSKSLYEEAIADAQKLRELAEETAKNRVVEAVMPQIRDLVNRRILGEQLEDFEMEEEETLDVLPPAVDDLSVLDIDLEEETEETPPPVINVSAQGDVNIEVESAGKTEEEDLVLSDAMAEALARLIKGDSPESQRLMVVEAAVVKMKDLLEGQQTAGLSPIQKKKLCAYFNHCLKEVISLRNSIILTELSTHEGLGQRLTEVIKEMRNMSKRQNILDFLFEQDEAEASEVEDVEVTDEVTVEPVEVDPEEAGEALVDLGAVLGLDVEVGAEAEEVETEEEDVVVADDEEFAFEGDYLGEADDVYEIDENMLRKEISRMRKLREQEESDAVDADPYLDHGGEVVTDDVLEVDEGDLINALADELGDVSAPTVESRRRRGSRVRRARPRRVVESRRTRKQLHQYRTALAGMKKQLVEMNLFNAKLLYANKLMQNKDLSMKQQRAIVEAIDNAKTLREAKLLYKSLSESLSRRSRGNKLNEGNLRTLGSSSRSTRSAQPASSGVEVDRWAVLAGIPGND